MRLRLRSWLAVVTVIGATAGLMAQTAQTPPAPADALRVARQAHQQRPSAATARALVLAADAANDTAQALATLSEAQKRWPADAGVGAAQGRVYWRLRAQRERNGSLAFSWER